MLCLVLPSAVHLLSGAGYILCVFWILIVPQGTAFGCPGLCPTDTNVVKTDEAPPNQEGQLLLVKPSVILLQATAPFLLCSLHFAHIFIDNSFV